MAELVSQNPHPETACKVIVARSLAAWRALEAADNITVLVVRLVWAGEEVTTAPPATAPSVTTNGGSETDSQLGERPSFQVWHHSLQCQQKH